MFLVYLTPFPVAPTLCVTRVLTPETPQEHFMLGCKPDQPVWRMVLQRDGQAFFALRKQEEPPTLAWAMKVHADFPLSWVELMQAEKP